MDREALLALAERVEKATGPDRFLDAQIASVIRLEKVPHWARNWTGEWKATEFGSVVLMEDSGNPGPHFMANEYTASLDAAMTLVPEGMMFQVYRGDMGEGSAIVTRLKQIGLPRVFAATPALALTAAALRTLAATSEGSAS